MEYSAVSSLTSWLTLWRELLAPGTPSFDKGVSRVSLVKGAERRVLFSATELVKLAAAAVGQSALLCSLKPLGDDVGSQEWFRRASIRDHLHLVESHSWKCLFPHVEPKTWIYLWNHHILKGHRYKLAHTPEVFFKFELNQVSEVGKHPEACVTLPFLNSGLLMLLAICVSHSLVLATCKYNYSPDK